jgi:protein TonB
VLAAELQLGEWVGVQFQLPNAAQALQTKAVVRHHNQLRCGFEFQGLSPDQRSMIRSWAGNSEPLNSAIEPPVPVSVSASTAVSVPNGVVAPVPTPPPQVKTAASLPAQIPAPAAPAAIQPRRVPASHKTSDAAVKRLLHMTLALLVIVGGWAGWQWYRGWEQLEERMARKDAHAQAPSAKVPAEVMERLLIRKIEPTYPDAARRANLQGVVVLDAVIAADGTVVNIHPRSGPDALISSAMDAARWWRFRPYRVRGEATAVETTLSVEFRL